MKHQADQPPTTSASKLAFGNKKKSILQQIPAFFMNALCHSTSKSSLQFKNIHVTSLHTKINDTQQQTSKYSNILNHSTQQQKENQIHSTKLSNKTQNQKLKSQDKTRPRKPFYSSNITTQMPIKDLPKTIDNKELNTLVTQFQQPVLSKSSQIKIARKNKNISLPYYISSLINSYSYSETETETETPQHQLAIAHLSTSLEILNQTKRVVKPSFVKVRSVLPKANRNTLVFDLDQTLIHCNHDIAQPYDVLLSIKLPNGQQTQAGINIRPFAKQCLKQLSQYYQIMVFTASHSCYAKQVVNYLDPQSSIISHSFYRESCYHSPQGMYIKDLRIIDRSLNNLLLIDNAAYSYCFQLENGVPIIPFYTDAKDTELKSLTNYLKLLAHSKNIRVEHSKILKADKFIKYSEPIKLLTELYSDYIS